MPTYRVTEPTSGRTFNITGDSPPTEQELEQLFSQMNVKASPAPTEQPKTYTERLGNAMVKAGDWMNEIRKPLARSLRPALEYGGMALGGALGAGGGTIAAPGPGTYAAGAAGSGLGYAAGKRAADALETFVGARPDKGILEETLRSAAELPRDVAEGAAMDLSGQAIGPIIGKTAGYVGGKVKSGVSQVLGATTGSGRGAVEEAMKGSKAFTDAMRGKVTGDEVVDNVRGALQTLKDARGQAYQESLAKIKSEKSLDISPVLNKMESLMKNYNIKQNADGTLDLSRVAMGKSGRNDIQEIIDTVKEWGTKKGDRTPIGLDTLKRQLDDFYSDSSQARQFVASLRSEVKNTIASNVPEYANMTKGYEEATKFIKDVESALMLRKNGMSGRVTADNTLRRLTSAMRENFEMRGELLDALGKKSGEDLAGQVAGYSMSPIVPRGLVGKAMGSSAGVLTYLDPKLFPLLTASSPRVMGEFLSTFGKVGSKMGKIVPGANYGIGASVGKSLIENPPSIVNTAEAADNASVVNRGKGIIGNRMQQLKEAEREPNNALSRPAIDVVPQEEYTGPKQMTREELSAYDKETQRIADELKAKRNALSEKPKAKQHIDVVQVLVNDPSGDGQELMYRTKTKPYKYFKYDPNE